MNEKRVADGLDHLQAAALEMIQAARAFLDVAEDLLSDRERAAEVMTMLGTVVTAATRATTGNGTEAAPRESGSAGGGQGKGPKGTGLEGNGLEGKGVKSWPSSVDVDGGRPGVQHIRVS